MRRAARRRAAGMVSGLVALALGWAGPRGMGAMLDPTFQVGSGANGYVEQILEQPDGKILICGLFDTYNGTAVPYIGRLHPDGRLDTAFQGFPNQWVRHMVLQPDGKIVIGGMFTAVANVGRNLIARLNPDGTVDRSFDPGRGCEVSIGTSIYGDSRTFVIWTASQGDGKILATGNFRDYNGVPSRGIVRINADGSRDAGFNVGTGMDTWGRFVLPLENGQVMASGWFSSFNNRSFNRMVRLNADGSQDGAFNAFFGDKTSVYSVAALADGKMLASGHSVNPQGVFGREIVRLNRDGTADPGWVGRTNDRTETILPQADGRALVSGYFTQVNGVPQRGLARFNADGTLDGGVRVEVDDFIWCVAPARGQRLLISGGFTQVDGEPRRFLARLNLPERAEAPGELRIMAARHEGGRFECAVQSVAGATYALQRRPEIAGAGWTTLPAVAGNGEVIALSDDAAEGDRFYRVEMRMP